MNYDRLQRMIGKRGRVVSITQYPYRPSFLITYADGLQRMFRARDCRIEKSVGKKIRIVRSCEEIECLVG